MPLDISTSGRLALLGGKSPMFNVGLFFALLVISASMGMIRITSPQPLLCVLVHIQSSIFDIPELSGLCDSGFDFGLERLNSC
ncbi:hypothetical protein BDN71DRAFT_1447799 [Pleurotus eryngii]|uniref:Uncharacterized protein n=1 Tax=Pleurotus eryngii TaxID=5323 RepID=A0A9P5ZWY5_PLEER|nr:hypothetical protein BDN71DRAFT_1447799 [Pleurotus eryngii]